MPDERNSIGPYYMGFGMLLVATLVAFLLFHEYSGREFGWVHVAVVAVLGFLALVMVRPDKFDAAFKAFIDALPFTKYRKPDGQ